MQQLKLLNRKFRWIAFALYLLPFVFIPIYVTLENSGVIAFDAYLRATVLQLGFVFWTFGAIILIFTKHKNEDEYIGSLRLLAFQKGIYFLVILLLVNLIISTVIRFWASQYYGAIIGIYSAALLTTHFIFFNFIYRLLKSRSDEK